MQIRCFVLDAVRASSCKTWSRWQSCNDGWPDSADALRVSSGALLKMNNVIKDWKTKNSTVRQQTYRVIHEMKTREALEEDAWNRHTWSSRVPRTRNPSDGDQTGNGPSS